MIPSRLSVLAWAWFVFVDCAAAQVITTIVGTKFTFPSQPVAALNAPLGGVRGFATDSSGQVYVADPDNNLVLRISPDQTLTVLAGNGTSGFSGDGGPAVNASLFSPRGVAIDSAGNVFIADSGNKRIRKVSAGIITTVAGNGSFGDSGDGGSATNATFNIPMSVAVDSLGNLYIADIFNNRIRKVASGVVTTIAGNGATGFSGDGGPAIGASLNSPSAVSVDLAGAVYIADTFNFRVRKVSNGIIVTVAGNGLAGASGDGGPATSAAVFPLGVAVDNAGNILIAEGSQVRRVSEGLITRIAGNGIAGFSGDSGVATNASLNFATSATPDSKGNIYIGDTNNSRIRRVSAGIITTIGGNGLFKFSGDGGPATSATFNQPYGVAVDSAGNIYVADTYGNRIRKVSGGIATTVAGNGLPGFSGDGGLATNASLNNPFAVAVDGTGSLYIADSNNGRVRKISGGVISTVAGNGSAGPSGDGGAATAAAIGAPLSLAFDSQGNLYIGDTANNQVRRVSAGVITTVAGNGVAGFSGDGGPAVQAALNFPRALAIDSAGNLYIAEEHGNRIRRVAGGIISTFVGSGNPGYFGDGGPATTAELFSPQGIVLDATNNLYIADTNNGRIRKVASGIISTIAGTGVQDLSGDGGPAISSTLHFPSGLAKDLAGNLFIADTGNDRIRKVLTSVPSFQAVPANLGFSLPAGAGKSPAQTITATPSIAGLAFSASSDVSWISISPASGVLPQPLRITVDPVALAPGNYSATIAITAPDASPATRFVQVSLAVQPATPGRIAVGSTSLSFALTQGAVPTTQQVTLSNQGSGVVSYRAIAATSSGGSWLSVAPSDGTVTATNSTTLSITATPGGLDVGSYSGTITVASPETGQQIVVPVVLAISVPQQIILLSQRGFTFTAVAGGGAVLPQNISILNQGSGAMNYTVQTSTQSGGSAWLSVSPSSGTVIRPLLDVSTIGVSVDASALTPGTYSGQITVRAPGASNSPQSATVLLTVLPPGSNPGPDVRPTGLVFTGVAGGSPGSQSITVANVTSSPINFGSSLGYNGPGGFLKYQPTDHDVSANSPVQIVVQPDFTSLSVGIHRAAVTLIFDDGSASVVNILTVVAPAGIPTGEARKDKDRFTTGCSPTQLLLQAAQVGFVTAPKVGFPTALIVKVADDCGSLFTSGSVGASFDNGDPPLSLISLQDGNWTATWQPTNATTSTTITFTAQAPGISGQAKVNAVSVGPGTGQPVVSGGLVSAATLKPDASVAPGELILIRGTALADKQASATSAPLSQLAGASVIIGGQIASLLYADAGQLLGVVPSLPLNSQPQFAVLRGDSYGLPSSVIIAAAHPGVFTKDGSGQGQGLIYKANSATSTLADSTNPVKAGDTVVIYCTGLGMTSADGKASNTPSVSIGGQRAQVGYAGMAITQNYPPGGAPTVLGVSTGLGGLYQITANIPAGLPSGPASIVVTSAGQSSPSGVTLVIAGNVSVAPVITSVDTVGGFPDIAQNGWIEIKGSNLAPPSTGASGVLWDAPAIQRSGMLPTQLNGVSVNVNGKSAFVYFISPTQVNVLTPLDNTTGAVQVLLNNGIPSAPFAVTLRTAAPSFALVGSTKYIAATDGRFFVGPSSLSAPGYPFLPAQPGDTIVLYGFGFGSPADPLVNGSASQSGALAVLPVCQVGGTNAQVQFAGLSPGNVGLYQINLTVPGTSNGDSEVRCTYSGQTSPAGAMIAVQR